MKHLKFFPLFLTLFLLIVAVPDFAYSLESPSTPSATGGSGGGGTETTFANMKQLDEICGIEISTSLQSDAPIATKIAELKIISKSVMCFENLFMGIVEEKIVGMTDFMREAVFAFLVLYVMFYGIQTSTGIITEQRTKGEFFIRALKITFVSWMIMQYGILELWYLTLDIYNSLLALVFIPTDLGECKPTATTSEIAGLWESMDCIFAGFIGWSTENGYGTEWKGTPLLFGMFTSALNSGSGGAFIALLVFMSILSIVQALMRVAFVYLLSMMGLILAFMIAPIMIPLMLFPQTKQMFEGWWKFIISMILQPVILFAYLSFMLAIFMEIIDGPGGLKEIYAQVQPHHEVGATNNRGTSTGVTSILKFFENPEAGQAGGGDTIELNAELAFNLLSVFVTCYLLSAFTNFVGQMGRELSGNALSPDLSSMSPSFLNRGM